MPLQDILLDRSPPADLGDDGPFLVADAVRAKDSGFNTSCTGERAVKEAEMLLKDEKTKAKGKRLMRLGSDAMVLGKSARDIGDSAKLAIGEANRKVRNGQSYEALEAEVRAACAAAEAAARSSDKAGMKALDLLRDYGIVRTRAARP